VIECRFSEPSSRGKVYQGILIVNLEKDHREGKAMEKEKLSAHHLGVTLGNDFIAKLFLPGPSKVEES